ncbi:MAG TPA: hypothetical protein VGX78_11490 [Pirellulales bacterium]|jgi:hypothetical protein|nr:hypothetical protein [Pirellulales bacterium]
MAPRQLLWTEKRYKGHCTDFWFDSAMAWMAQRKREGEPFLCYLATNAPHAPYIDLEEYAKPYLGKGPAEFFGMIAHLDQRWPKKCEAALGDKYEPSEKSPATRPNLVTVAFPTIAAATIDIAGVKVSSGADPKATGVTLTATLSAGRTKLKAWFADADGNDLCGAFFVTVARKN